MLPSKNRLSLKYKKREKLDQKVSDSFFTLLYSKKESGSLKAAIIISKRVAVKAVDRNRIKRMIAESLKDKLDLKGNLIVKANTNIANWKSGQVMEKLTSLINKLK